MGIPKATNKAVGVVGASWIETNEEGFIKEEHRYHDQMTTMGQLNPDKKNPTRPVVTAPPDGTEKYEAKEEKDGKDEKDKAAPEKEKEKEKAAPGKDEKGKATPPKDEKEKGAPAKVEEEKKALEIETKWMTALNAHKMEEAYKLIDNSVVFVDYTMPADTKGLKAFKDLMGTYLTAFPDVQMKMTQGFADGDFYVGEIEYTGTQKAALGPIKATNKAIDLHQLEVDQIKDGKIVKGWTWGNNVELLTELGAMPGHGDTPPAPSAAPSSSAKPAAPK
jgi:predicted ester cyclase